MTISEEKILKKIKYSISEKSPDAEVFLYGSRARGDESKDSDWDILILSKTEDFLELEDEIRDDLYLIELESGQVISLLTYSKSYWDNVLNVSPLYKNVLKEALRL